MAEQKPNVPKVISNVKVDDAVFQNEPQTAAQVNAGLTGTAEEISKKPTFRSNVGQQSASIGTELGLMLAQAVDDPAKMPDVREQLAKWYRRHISLVMEKKLVAQELRRKVSILCKVADAMNEEMSTISALDV